MVTREDMDGPDPLDVALIEEGVLTNVSLAKSIASRRKSIQGHLDGMEKNKVTREDVPIMALSQKEDEFLVGLKGLKAPEKHEIGLKGKLTINMDFGGAKKEGDAT